MKRGYGYDLALFGAVRDYNASHALTPVLLNTGNAGYLDLGTEHNDYVSDVIRMAYNCF
jgi:hypothetical protein